MFKENHKKESPILSLLGMGGGISSKLIGSLSKKIIATGGAVVTPGNGYRYHFITADSQNFEVLDISTSHPGTVDYFLVAGGGSGGGEFSTPNQVCGGGGGAGGVLTGSTPVSVQSYTIGIGAGGAAPAQGRNGGVQGGNSTAFGLTAYGGGGGGHYNDAGADPGGSGGGTGRRGTSTIYYGYNPSTPAPVLTSVPLPSPYTETQGYPGGVAGGTSNDGGGGGGGAGAAGSAGGTGDGGVGVAAFGGDTGVPTDYGDSGPSAGRWFAGGGGGGINAGGAGGAGGGADAPGQAGLSGSQNGAAGQVNTGGGGSGGRSGSGPTPSASGGAGGSGICIIRYQYVEGSTPSSPGVKTFTLKHYNTGGTLLSTTPYSDVTSGDSYDLTTAGYYTVTIPPASDPISFDMWAWGGGGGSAPGPGPGNGGAGGGVRGRTTFNAPSVLTIIVGNGGAHGVGGSPDGGSSPDEGGGGGSSRIAATEIPQPTINDTGNDYLLIGGGGGGGTSWATSGIYGGSAGYPSGNPGGLYYPADGAVFGKGGTQSAGGAHGGAGRQPAGTPGAKYSGGPGQGGGGGGGYYGGGGAGGYYAIGGGGSGYIDSTLTNTASFSASPGPSTHKVAVDDPSNPGTKPASAGNSAVAGFVKLKVV